MGNNPGNFLHRDVDQRRPIDIAQDEADRYSKNRWHGVEDLILGNVHVATRQFHHYGKIPPKDGARSKLTLDWFHSKFGNDITPLEYRRFRSFKYGYSRKSYQDGIEEGRRIQKYDFKDYNLSDDQERYLQSFQERERLGLAFEVSARELVDHIRAVVFYRQDEMVPNVDVFDIINGGQQVEFKEFEHFGGVAAEDEFEESWWLRNFGQWRSVETHRIERAMYIGYKAARFSGVIRGIDTERRLHFVVSEE